MEVEDKGEPAEDEDNGDAEKNEGDKKEPTKEEK